MNRSTAAGVWHFATYVDRYATDGYGEPRTVLDAIELAGAVGDLSVLDLNWPFPPGASAPPRYATRWPNRSCGPSP